MAASGRIIRGSLQVVTVGGNLKEEAKVNIVVNAVEQVDYSIVKKKGEGCSCVVFPQPLVIDQCDVINFITRSNNPNAKNAYLTILIELDL